MRVKRKARFKAAERMRHQVGSILTTIFGQRGRDPFLSHRQRLTLTTGPVQSDWIVMDPAGAVRRHGAMEPDRIPGPRRATVSINPYGAI